MISNPGLPRLEPTAARSWPRLFSHWQLLSLVPSLVPRLTAGARVLQLEVGGGALLSSLARSYPASHFIGLTAGAGGERTEGPVKFSSPNLHFKRVDTFDLTRFKDVDLVLALGGLEQHIALRAIRCMSRGAYFVRREPDAEVLRAPRRDARFGGFYSNGAEGLPEVPAGGDRLQPARLLEMLFAEVQALRLPEDPGFVYYVARAG